MENNKSEFVREFDQYENVEELKNKVDSMILKKKSLRREIDENFLVTSNLREQLNALSSSTDQAKQLLKKINKEIEEKNSILASVDSEFCNRRRELDHEQSTLKIIRASFDAEVATFNEQNKAKLAIIEIQEEKLERKNIDINKREEIISEKEKQILGQISELSERLVSIQQEE